MRGKKFNKLLFLMWILYFAINIEHVQNDINIQKNQATIAVNSTESVDDEIKKLEKRDAKFNRDIDEFKTEVLRVEDRLSSLENNLNKEQEKSLELKNHLEKLELQIKSMEANSSKIQEKLEKKSKDNEADEKRKEEQCRIIKKEIKEGKWKLLSTNATKIFPTINWNPNLTKKVQPFTFQWTIHSISEKLRDASMNLESNWFKLTGYPVEAKAKLFFKDSTSDLYVALSFKDPKKPLSSFYPFPQVTYVLKDQRVGVKVKDRVTSHSLSFNSKELAFDEDVLEEFLLFKPLLLSSHFIKDDSIVLEIYVETPSMTRLNQSKNGRLVSHVDHFEERWRLAKESLVKCTSSPYFYTQPNGYRVRLELYLGYGKYIIPKVHFLTTDHDKALSIHFPHRTTLTIFNTKDCSNNLVRYKDADINEKADYQLNYISYNEVKGLVADNTFFYQVDIKPLQIFFV